MEAEKHPSLLLLALFHDLFYAGEVWRSILLERRVSPKDFTGPAESDRSTVCSRSLRYFIDANVSSHPSVFLPSSIIDVPQ